MRMFLSVILLVLAVATSAYTPWFIGTGTFSAPSLTGINLSNLTFTCGSAGTVGAVTVTGTGSIGAATLSLTGTDAAQFSLSSTTVPSNLTVGASPSGCPRAYSINIVATLAGATGSPFTQAFTITGNAAGTAQIPGPSAALFSAQTYYTCVSNKFVAPKPTGASGNTGNTTGSPWDIVTASTYAAPAGTCINLAVGNYTSDITAVGGIAIVHGGTSSTKTTYVVWRCASLSTVYVSGSVSGEGSGCVLGLTSGGSNIFGVGSGTSFVMFDGFEFAGTPSLGGVCLDNENNGSGAATAHHVWSLNNDLHGCGLGGIVWNYTDWLFLIHNVWHDNATTNGFCGSGLSFFRPAGLTGYTPTSGHNDFWHSATTGLTYNDVLAYNVGYHNYNATTASCSGGGPTDGEGIIMDTFSGCDNAGSSSTCPYTGNVLIMGNIMWGNGGGGIEVFLMLGPPDSPSIIDVVNNTTYSNYWDPNNVGSFSGNLYTDISGKVHFFNNIAVTLSAATSKTCTGSGNVPCTILDERGNGNSTWRTNITNPGGHQDLGGAGATYPTTGTNANKPDGTDPKLTTLNPITARTGTGSTAVSNFALQGTSPAIGFGQAFDLWQQSGTVDVGACVFSAPGPVTNCP